jgi:beta-barrel assembly-enhancing protease
VLRANFKAIFLLGFLTSSFLGCAPLFQAKDKVIDLLTDYVPLEVDSQLGRTAWPSVEKNLLKNISIEPLMEPLFRELPKVTSLSFDWKLGVLDNETPNAFAMPGGIIVFHSGLIQKAASADEVLGVMAHELGHVVLRHGVRGIVQDRVLSLMVGVLSSVILGDLGSLGGVVASGAYQMTSLKFSRDQERQADVFALELLQAAKISPAGMARFFQSLAKGGNGQDSQPSETASSQGNTNVSFDKALSWLSTHPMPEERAAQLSKLIQDSQQLDLPAGVVQEFDRIKQQLTK